MSNPTYTPIQSYTFPSANASYTFTSIPSTYTDLILVANTTVSAGSPGIYLKVGNGSIDTGNNYSWTRMFGTGSSAGSDRGSTYAAIYSGENDSSVQGTTIWHIQNYSSTTTYKSVLCRNNCTAVNVAGIVGLWSSTSAINTIQVSTTSSTFTAGSTLTLYGVQAAGVGAYATGGTIYQDSTYFYHVFGQSGTFTPSQNLSADILVVAGGGSGGAALDNTTGGGGAGGLLEQLNRSLTSGTNYTVTIGAGGNGVATNANGNNGSNSVFDTITAIGGGAGGGAGASGASGGSGGGSGGTGSYGSGTQGNSGGATGYGNAGSPGTVNYGGGGGGAGGAAPTANGSNQSGGIGRTSALINSIGAATGSGQYSGGNWYFAGGGGGAHEYGNLTSGAGGLGGGGTGEWYNNRNNTAGAINTGGGSGGSMPSGTGSASKPGGSGIVIVRYAK